MEPQCPQGAQAGLGLLHVVGWVCTGQGGSAPSRKGQHPPGKSSLCRSGSEGLLSFSTEGLLCNILFIQTLLGIVCWACLGCRAWGHHSFCQASSVPVTCHLLRVTLSPLAVGLKHRPTLGTPVRWCQAPETIHHTTSWIHRGFCRLKTKGIFCTSLCLCHIHISSASTTGKDIFTNGIFN